jgi:hypothetical protein
MTTTGNLAAFLEQGAYPALFARLPVAFPDFDWKRRTVDGKEQWVASSWPSGFPLKVEPEDPDRLIVYHDRPGEIGVHGHHGEEVAFLAYLVGEPRIPRGQSFVEAARRLCEKAAVAFPKREPTSVSATTPPGRISRPTSSSRASSAVGGSTSRMGRR